MFDFPINPYFYFEVTVDFIINKQSQTIWTFPNLVAWEQFKSVYIFNIVSYKCTISWTENQKRWEFTVGNLDCEPFKTIEDNIKSMDVIYDFLSSGDLTEARILIGHLTDRIKEDNEHANQ